MTRTLNGTLAANIATQFPTPAFALDILPADGSATKRLTTHPFEQTVDGNLYQSSGLTLSRLRFGVDRNRASSEAVVSCETNSPVQIADVRSGFYRSANYEIGIFDYSVAAPVRTVLLTGMVGRPEWDDRELVVKFDLKGNLRRGQQIIVEKATPHGRCSLGDVRCRVPMLEDATVTHITVRADSTAYVIGDYIRVFQASSYNDRIFRCTVAGTSAGSAPTFDLTVGNTTVDGTATFTTEQSWARAATVATVTDLQKFTVTYTESRAVDGWFGGFSEGLGLAVFRTGQNTGRQMEIIKWTNSTAEVQLAAPMPYDVAVSDTLDLIPACNKTFETHWDKFNTPIDYNGAGFPGEPFKGPVVAVDAPV